PGASFQVLGFAGSVAAEGAVQSIRAAVSRPISLVRTRPAAPACSQSASRPTFSIRDAAATASLSLNVPADPLSVWAASFKAGPSRPATAARISDKDFGQSSRNIPA